MGNIIKLNKPDTHRREGLQRGCSLDMVLSDCHGGSEIVRHKKVELLCKAEQHSVLCRRKTRRCMDLYTQ